uniref:Uncharacterized protein n=1 Tax=Romanomermis culicivorax TaxID=13658 RepID=A0A915K2P4_ROMCU
MVKIARICVIGCEKVGKTGIIHQLAYGRDITNSDTYTLNVDVDKACLIILDTSGADLKINLDIKRSYLQLCDGYMFVYSIDNPESYSILAQLKTLIDKNAKDRKEVPIVVLANKKDLGQINSIYRRVDGNVAASWCAKEKSIRLFVFRIEC